MTWHHMEALPRPALQSAQSVCRRSPQLDLQQEQVGEYMDGWVSHAQHPLALFPPISRANNTKADSPHLEDGGRYNVIFYVVRVKEQHLVGIKKIPEKMQLITQYTEECN